MTIRRHEEQQRAKRRREAEYRATLPPSASEDAYEAAPDIERLLSESADAHPVSCPCSACEAEVLDGLPCAGCGGVEECERGCPVLLRSTHDEGHEVLVRGGAVYGVRGVL